MNLSEAHSMVRHLLKKRLMWGMVIAIGIAIAIVGSTLGDSRSMVTAATKPSYTVKDLGTLGGNRSSASSINNAGQVVGASATSNNDTHAVLWNKGNKIDLGVIGYKNSAALSINNVGKVVGFSFNGSSGQHAVLWDKGKKIELGTIGGEKSIAVAINDAGNVVGSSSNSSGDVFAVLWNKGNKTDWKILDDTESDAFDINNAGQVVGTTSNGSNSHAVLWDKGNKTYLAPHAGNETSIARAINNAGKIVGSFRSDRFADDYEVLWDKNKMINLGTLGGKASSALAINNAGKIVGFSQAQTGVFHAFLWDKNSIKDLNDLISPKSGWLLLEARGINDRGQIVGQGLIKGQFHAFLLTPIRATH
jgi:probable HAF family extracellular repeat protein